MNDRIAQLIAGRMNDDQKRQMIQAFYDGHKQDENIDRLVDDMKRALQYTGNDVPKK
jgi:hypothetical protein